MTKRIHVRIAGTAVIHDIAISPDTTTGDVLAAVQCDPDWVLILVRGEAPSHEKAKIYEQVKEGETVFAMQHPEPGG